MRRACVLAVTASVLAGCSGNSDTDELFYATPTPTATVTAPVPVPSAGTTESAPNARTPGPPAMTPSPIPTSPAVRTPDANVAPGPEQLRKTAVPVGIAPKGADQATDASAAQAALRTFLTAISTSNGYQACAQLSVAGRRAAERVIREVAPETGGAPCENTLPLYQSTYSGSPVRVRRLTVTRGTATAVGPNGEMARLSKYGDAWLVDRYGEITG